MIKKASTDERKTVHAASEFAPGRQKRLEIKQIRSYVDKLQGLPDGDPLPNWSDLTIGDRFAIALRLVPATDRVRVLGKSDSHIRRYERGMDIPLTVVAALAAEIEIPLEWIVSGRSIDRRLSGVHHSHEQQANADSEDVPVQKLAFKASAGRGEIMLDDTADHVRFPRAILQHNGVAPENARLMEAFGESMRPTINDGDMLLIDVSPTAKQVVEGKIYVFSVGDDAFVKRLRRMGDQVLMISDNKDMFPDTEVPREALLRVYGRVKWAGRSL